MRNIHLLLYTETRIENWTVTYMGIFAIQKQRKDFRLAVQALRGCGIAVWSTARRVGGDAAEVHSAGAV